MAIHRTVHLAMSGTRNTSMSSLNHLLCTHRAAKVSKCSLEQFKVLQPVQRLQHMHAFVLALQTPQTDSECGSEVDNTVSSPASGVVQCSRDSSSSWHCAPKGSTKEEPRRTSYDHQEIEKHEGSGFTRDKRELSGKGATAPILYVLAIKWVKKDKI